MSQRSWIEVGSHKLLILLLMSMHAVAGTESAESAATAATLDAGSPGIGLPDGMNMLYTQS